ncbi:hypothetical protein F6Y05_35400 [Bacillus megaterium]|nr:hypothetical protein [Priestia megaterium]
MVRKNDKDYPILKDIMKRTVYWIFVLLFIAITISLIANSFTVNDSAVPSKKKEESLVTKEIKKETKGKVEKTREVTKTEKPPQSRQRDFKNL